MGYIIQRMLFRNFKNVIDYGREIIYTHLVPAVIQKKNIQVKVVNFQFNGKLYCLTTNTDIIKKEVGRTASIFYDVPEIFYFVSMK